MDRFVFHIVNSFNLDDAWQSLEACGCQLLYSMQEPDEQYIIGYLPVDQNLEKMLLKFPFVFQITPSPIETIDWESQWAIHGRGYHEGHLHIDLQDFSQDDLLEQRKKLKLKPGPGFGDLSHPTTRLVLRLMNHRLVNKHVIDVGCGSGILALAAKAMGAAFVCGIDIDVEALKHAKINSQLNDMHEINFFLPEEIKSFVPKKEPLLILMNMIQMEQGHAWHSLKEVHHQIKEIITSGVMCEEEVEYLKRCKKMGWQLVDKREEEGWLGFVFKKI